VFKSGLSDADGPTPNPGSMNRVQPRRRYPHLRDFIARFVDLCHISPMLDLPVSSSFLQEPNVDGGRGFPAIVLASHPEAWSVYSAGN
jgi:hypothetical protein